MNRIIGEITGTQPGPLLIFIGGLHGNEAKGMIALENVFSALAKESTPFAGRAIGLRGNLTALRQNKRYVSEDLNRIWGRDAHQALENSQERLEMEELKALIHQELKGEYSRVYLLDLHTTSAPTIPFAVTQNNPTNTAFIQQIDVPYITGLAGHLNGTLLAWMCDQGHCGLAFEAGQHQSKTSMIIHEAFVRLSMHYSGFMTHLTEKEVAELHFQMDDELKPKHNHFKLVERYSIDAGEEFQMEEGYTNFAKIRKGQVLAKNKYGDILSSVNGNIFMPLYQKQGSDGFFIVEPQTS